MILTIIIAKKNNTTFIIVVSIIHLLAIVHCMLQLTIAPYLCLGSNIVEVM